MRIFYKIALSIAIAMSAVGIVRARAKIGLQNLAYNIRRLVTLERIAAACPTPLFFWRWVLLSGGPVRARRARRDVDCRRLFIDEGQFVVDA